MIKYRRQVINNRMSQLTRTHTPEANSSIPRSSITITQLVQFRESAGL